MGSIAARCPLGFLLIVVIVLLLLVRHSVLVSTLSRNIRPVQASRGIDLGGTHEGLFFRSLVRTPASLEGVLLLLESDRLCFACRAIRGLGGCKLKRHLLILLLLELVVNGPQVVAVLAFHILPQFLDFFILHLQFCFQNSDLLLEA